MMAGQDMEVEAKTDSQQATAMGAGQQISSESLEQPYAPPALPHLPTHQTNSGPKYELDFLKTRLQIIAQGLQPSVYKRKGRETDVLQELGIKVADWVSVMKRHKSSTPKHAASGVLSRVVVRRSNDGTTCSSRGSIPKLSRAVKSKSNGAGRTYTSKYRGVHQTFPTKRWEAQFRRNGKPTSLGCFDHEEEAAKAYDKMMLWCELHNTAGLKGGITNFDPSEYEKDLPWLQSVSQDELIEALRSDGRRQAAHRMLRQKREGLVGQSTSEDDSDEQDQEEGTPTRGLTQQAQTALQQLQQVQAHAQADTALSQEHVVGALAQALAASSQAQAQAALASLGALPLPGGQPLAALMQSQALGLGQLQQASALVLAQQPGPVAEQGPMAGEQQEPPPGGQQQ